MLTYVMDTIQASSQTPGEELHSNILLREYLVTCSIDCYTTQNLCCGGIVTLMFSRNYTQEKTACVWDLHQCWRYDDNLNPLMREHSLHVF